MAKRILITGGCGFIGHHFVEHIHRKTNWNIVVLDKLTYASMGLERLRENELIHSSRIHIFTVDLCLPISQGLRKELGEFDYIVHMAAETHVDNSISDPVPFIQNNINSTLTILEFARTQSHLEKLFYFSTDEVYGPALNEKLFKENERHNPTNPYSASKSAAEQICFAYENTFKIPLISVNVMNAFGERQHVEKFIPKVIKNILLGKTTLIHAYPDKITSGSRFYIHARNISDAVMFLIEKGVIGETYNISGEKEISNLDLALKIAAIMKKNLQYDLVDFHSDRPGHDLRYGLDGTKLKQLGWMPPHSFDQSLENVVKWTIQNPKWLEE